MIAYRGQVKASGTHTQGARPCHTWWWIESGSVTVTTRNEALSVTAGQWVLIPSGLWREQRFSHETRIISVNFLAHWRKHLPVLRHSRPILGTKETVPGLLETAGEITETPKEEASFPPGPAPSVTQTLELTGALYRFVGKLFAYAVTQGAIINTLPSTDSRIERVIRDIHSDLRAGPLPFARWQKQTGLGRTQLERLARRHLHRSLHTYRDELLTTAVCRALTTQHLMVKQAAETYGFVDTAHFCRWLRAQIGQSPASLQRSDMV